MKKQNIGIMTKTLLVFLTGLLGLACGCAAKRDEESLFDLMADANDVTVQDTVGCIGEEPSTAAGGVQEKSTVFVHICGEVMCPGVYEVPAESRIYDVVMAAGGFSGEASEDYLNLAAPVSDGMQIRILSEEEAQKQRQKQANDAMGLININTASAAELCTLPGIGESRAEDIVAYRTQNGMFTTKEEIMQVSGIKDSLYRKIEDKICIE